MKKFNLLALGAVCLFAGYAYGMDLSCGETLECTESFMNIEIENDENQTPTQYWNWNMGSRYPGITCKYPIADAEIARAMDTYEPAEYGVRYECKRIVGWISGLINGRLMMHGVKPNSTNIKADVENSLFPRQYQLEPTEEEKRRNQELLKLLG